MECSASDSRFPDQQEHQIQECRVLPEVLAILDVDIIPSLSAFAALGIWNLGREILPVEQKI